MKTHSKITIKTLCLALTMFFIANIQAQEVLTNIQRETADVVNTKSTDKLTLPFFDDFSTSDIYPSSDRWSDRHALVNTGFSVFPPNYKAVTLDVLDEHGAVYPHAISNPFPADYLTSKAIRLDSIFTDGAERLSPADSLYLSFYYQPQGKGNAPEPHDSLVLEFGIGTLRQEFVEITTTEVLVDLLLFDMLQDSIFPGDTLRAPEGCNPNLYVIAADTLVPGDIINLPCDSLFQTVTDTTWHHIWAAAGQSLEEFMSDNNGAYFKQVMIPITDPKYFTDSFFVRFFNYGSIPASTQPSNRGNEDSWNLDFIYLDKDRTINNTYYPMVSFSGQAPSFLKKYRSMPYRQYRANPTSAIRESLEMYITNLDNVNHNTRYEYVVEQIDGSQRFRYDGGSAVLGPYQYSGFQNCIGDNAAHACPYVASLFSLDFFIDSTSFLIRHYISDSSQSPPWVDSLVYHQGFYNYYAYDDGTPEMGYGVEPALGMFAVKFELATYDTLRGVQILFNKTLKNANDNMFDIVVWKDDNGRPGEEVYRMSNQRPSWTEQPYSFSRYEFNKNIYLSGIFYVGLMQQTSNNINVGFDASCDNSQYNFFNTSGEWMQSIFPGSIMIRPVLGRPYFTSVDENTETITTSYTLYPNPARDKLYIETNNHQDCDKAVIKLFDLCGRQVLESQYKKEINLGDLNNGLYLISIISADGKCFTEKIMINR